MKKALVNTKVTVKLRKAEKRNEWYLYLEAYPVFTAESSVPQRTREYLNRTIATPLWDKSRNARTSKEGNVSFKPKRDINGVIQCKSHLDQEACIYADKVREIRQREFDNAFLYTDTDSEQAQQLERSRYNFLEYFREMEKKRHAQFSEAISTTWNRVYENFKIFINGDTIPFSKIDLKLIEEFRLYLLSAKRGGFKTGTISPNTASTYFSVFKAVLKQAFIDGYLTIDLSAKAKSIQGRESRREYLTVEELNTLARTPFDPIVKRAALFSALTGLRHSDIQKLTWAEIEEFNGGYRLNFTQPDCLIPHGFPNHWKGGLNRLALPSTSPSTASGIRSLPCSWQAAPTSIPSANCLVIPTSKPPRSMQRWWTKRRRKPQRHLHWICPL